MKTMFIPLCILLVLSAVAARGQAIKLSPDQGERAKAAAELRLQYAASKDYNPYDPDVPAIKKSCRELMKQHEFARALAEAGRGLEKDRYNISLLIIRASAARALGKIAEAEEVRSRWMSLMDSILVGGDGRDFASAFQVISVEEEYAVLQVMGLNLLSQSLVGHDGGEFDVLLVKDPESGKEFQLHFNVDLPKRWLDAQFAKPGSAEKEVPRPQPATVDASSAPGGKDTSSRDARGRAP